VFYTCCCAFGLPAAGTYPAIIHFVVLRACHPLSLDLLFLPAYAAFLPARPITLHLRFSRRCSLIPACPVLWSVAGGFGRLVSGGSFRISSLLLFAFCLCCFVYLRRVVHHDDAPVFQLGFPRFCRAAGGSPAPTPTQHWAYDVTAPLRWPRCPPRALLVPSTSLWFGHSCGYIYFPVGSSAIYFRGVRFS